MVWKDLIPWVLASQGDSGMTQLQNIILFTYILWAPAFLGWGVSIEWEWRILFTRSYISYKENDFNKYSVSFKKHVF